MSLFATKSVSQASSMMVAVPSPLSTAATRPSLVERSARFALPFAPLRRRISTAFSMSPSASTRAFLVSTMPVPRRSRRVLTSSRLKLAISVSLLDSWSYLDSAGGCVCVGGLGCGSALGVGLGLGSRRPRVAASSTTLGRLGLRLGDGLGDDLGLGRSLLGRASALPAWRSSCSHSASGSTAETLPSASGFW